MDVEVALDLVDDDLPDGAWMAVLCEMTGMSPDEVVSELFALEERRRAEFRNGKCRVSKGGG